MEAEDLSHRIFTEDAIAETPQYDFDMIKISVSPKHVQLPTQKEDLKGIVDSMQ